MLVAAGRILLRFYWVRSYWGQNPMNIIDFGTQGIDRLLQRLLHALDVITGIG